MASWEQMIERMQWRNPFGDLPDAWKNRHMRRACWPKKMVYRGQSADGTETIPEKRSPYECVWRIWHQDDVGDQSTYEGGLCKGWGGQLGSEDAEKVMVNGDLLTDGTMYTPTEGDRLATDWTNLDGSV